jgi:prepilin signal peptidase PulO-like enzyme (type II secretory pathway)
MLENLSFVTLVSCVACLALAVFSSVLLAMHRVGRNTRMPFVPFLTGAYIVLKMTGGRVTI